MIFLFIPPYEGEALAHGVSYEAINFYSFASHEENAILVWIRHGIRNFYSFLSYEGKEGAH